MSGTLIDGRYRVVSRLGAGGMADVFLAEDQQLGRKVALKLLHRRFAADPGFVERFRREAQAAAGLNHPNVVGVYDRGAYDGTYYIAMEYLPGRSLKQLIREEAPLDPVRAIDITLQILKAARFAHRRGVIHRDLKPHNVIVDEADQAKVTDFGIARAGASDMTETGSIMGTAQYLSPEQAQGHAVSAGSDLYSVGVVLYEMLTGRVPFDAESAVSIALKHVSEAPSAPRALNPAIPQELEQVVLWALNKDPADRPADADQLIAALTQVKGLILASTRGQRTASMAALAEMLPNEPFVVAEPTDGGSGTFAPVAAPWNGDGTGTDGFEHVPPERRRRWWPWLLALLLLLLLIGGAVAAYVLTRPVEKIVPNVVRKQVQLATAEVENAGFNPAIINVPDRHTAGTVIRQNPLAGVKAKENSTVVLTVSSGPGSVSIPPVQNLTQADAQRLLRSRGLRVNVQQESSSTVAVGHATRTDPVSGTSEQRGSMVTLYISTGQPTAAVPSVVGLSESDARARLTGAGFTVSTGSQTSSTATPGNVISQDPIGGTSATVGTNVSIVIASAPTTAQVPDVRGKSLTDAENTLSAAGFKVATQSHDVSKKKNDGIVLSESPGPGSTQQKGSTVTIVIGHFVKPATTTTTTPSTTTTTPSTTSTTTPTTATTPTTTG
jgi:serine/threonine-protein kinase